VGTRVFVQANDNQLVAAKVAKFALETRGRAAHHRVPVMILNVDEMPRFAALAGARYLCGGNVIEHDNDRVQSFTLARFLPPELMGYSGRALVIDPDILALADIGELLSLDLHGNAIAACRRDMGWETSVMLLDCGKLAHWRIDGIIAALTELRLDYLDLMWLRNEANVLALSGAWNSLDHIAPDTKMLHMTRIDTQPWKTGLAIGSTLPAPPPVLGFIPRAFARRLVGKPEPRYKAHPSPDVERTFMTVFKEAVDAGALARSEIEEGIANRHLRPDIWNQIA
jgi:hypothetical protein